MTKREELIAAIDHLEGPVPAWTMAFFNIDLAKKLLGEENVMTDYLPQEKYKYGGADDENRERNVRYAQATDNCAVAVGRGGNFAFGHGGPGEMMERVIERGDDRLVSVCETGVKKLIQWNPHFYHSFDHPLETLSQVVDLTLPDAADPVRYAGIEEDTRYYRSRGYLPYANLNGIFSGLHYFFYPYDKLFLDMLLDRDNLRILIAKLADFNLSAAERLLRAGVEMITTCDDLGDGRNLLFSPDLYRELFKSYHRDLAGLCHNYGAWLHLHSHGNILRLLPDLVEVGIDIINPFDPTETGPLEEIKARFGKDITIAGGISKFFFGQDRNTMRDTLKETISTGRRGGGFILMDSGGIPENVDRETYLYYRSLSAELRV